jgi:hypothetical protein
MEKVIYRSTRFTYIADKKTFVADISDLGKVPKVFSIEIETTGQVIEFAHSTTSRVDGELQSLEFISKDGYAVTLFND